MDLNTIKSALLELDYVLRPVVIYVNPHDKEIFLTALGDLKDKVVITETDLVEIGKAYAINRDQLRF